MSEQLISQFKGAQAGTINEPQFKRLCGAVWAESVINFDEHDGHSVYLDQESALLKAVLVRLRHKLDLEAESTEELFALPAERASLYRDEINRIMRQNAAAPFDYNRIINRLLRETVKAETA